MKKKILILTTALVLTFAATYAKSNENKIPENVSSVFARDFSRARDINWELYKGYYKASFLDMGVVVYAFYNADAEFIGMASNLTADRLPDGLQSDVKRKYEGYWITDLFQVTNGASPVFFITIENADRKIILKAESNQSWSHYAELKKD
jgi:predicted membrane-bound mannosyltransferase